MIIVTHTEDCIYYFPHLNFSKFTTYGSYYELVKARNFLKENFSGITTQRGGGKFGYLGNIMCDAIYTTITLGQDFVIIPDTGMPMVII